MVVSDYGDLATWRIFIHFGDHTGNTNFHPL